MVGGGAFGEGGGVGAVVELKTRNTLVKKDGNLLLLVTQWLEDDASLLYGPQQDDSVLRDVTTTHKMKGSIEFYSRNNLSFLDVMTVQYHQK